MSTSTPITEFYSDDFDKEIAHLLTYAKKQLAEIPRQKNDILPAALLHSHSQAVPEARTVRQE